MNLQSLFKSALQKCGIYVSRRDPSTLAHRDQLTEDCVWRDISSLLPPTGGLCFDVGANKGHFICQCRKHAAHLNIHAFEPNPALYAELQSTYRKQLGVHCFQVGVGATLGHAVLNIYRNDELSSMRSISANSSNPFRNESIAREVDVPIVTLDKHATQHHISHVELLKVDTQGYDLQVLKGAKHLLENRAIALIYVELNFTELYAHQDTTGALIDYLLEHHYTLFNLYEVCRWPSSAGHRNGIFWCNALFLPIDSVKAFNNATDGRAIASTSIGVQSVAEQVAGIVTVADEPPVFADAVVNLLRNPQSRRDREQKGR